MKRSHVSRKIERERDRETLFLDCVLCPSHASFCSAPQVLCNFYAGPCVVWMSEVAIHSEVVEVIKSGSPECTDVELHLMEANRSPNCF